MYEKKKLSTKKKNEKVVKLLITLVAFKCMYRIIAKISKAINV